MASATAADDGVGDVDELDLERADVDGLLGLDLVEARLVLEFVFLQAALHQRQSEGGAVDRHVELGRGSRGRRRCGLRGRG